MKQETQASQEIKLYIKKARRRIHSAKVLLEAGEHNDAISRAYYAFFDAATAALATKGLRAKTHHGLVIVFDNHFIKTDLLPVKIGRWLAKALEARQEADYEIHKEFPKETVEAAIKTAKEFVDAVEKLLQK